MSNAISGVGAHFQRRSGSTWVSLAEISAISGPSMTRDVIDVTSLDSIGGYREFIAGFRQAGTVNLSMNFIRENYDLMKTDFEDDDLQYYRITLPDADSTTLTFYGLVTELPLTIPADDKISMDVVIQISGRVELSENSGDSVDPSIPTSEDVPASSEDLLVDGAFFIATNGNNANPGTLAQPWLTLEYMFTQVGPGDTVYLRGGTYNATGASQTGWNFQSAPDGAAGNLIYLLNYPGETPIFDCTAIDSQNAHSGMEFYGLNYWYIRGITLRNLVQASTGDQTVGFAVSHGANHLTLERCVAHHIGGHGYNVQDSADDILFLNCDAYYCQDPYSTSPNENADGFHCWSSNDNSTITYRGCRSWWNSDDGFDFFNNDGIIIVDGCWSFWNGFIPGTSTPAGNGMGFKMGDTTLVDDIYRRIYQNCLSFENKTHGFDKSTTLTHKLINNTSYDNGWQGSGYFGGEFSMNSHTEDFLRNNIAMRATGDSASDFSDSSALINDHNSWNLAGTPVPADEFVSIDSTGVDGARGSDGSLPVLNFLKLKATSQYINAGVNVGLAWLGAAPDLGAFERQ